MAMSKTVGQEYKDWIALLKEHNAEDLLKDTYNVWLEAWTVATILASKNSKDHVIDLGLHTHHIAAKPTVQ